jgi:hypothetical protein
MTLSFHSLIVLFYTDARSQLEVSPPSAQSLLMKRMVPKAYNMQDVHLLRLYKELIILERQER